MEEVDAIKEILENVQNGVDAQTRKKPKETQATWQSAENPSTGWEYSGYDDENGDDYEQNVTVSWKNGKIKKDVKIKTPENYDLDR